MTLFDVLSTHVLFSTRTADPSARDYLSSVAPKVELLDMLTLRDVMSLWHTEKRMMSAFDIPCIWKSLYHRCLSQDRDVRRVPLRDLLHKGPIRRSCVDSTITCGCPADTVVPEYSRFRKFGTAVCRRMDHYDSAENHRVKHVRCAGAWKKTKTGGREADYRRLLIEALTDNHARQCLEICQRHTPYAVHSYWLQYLSGLRAPDEYQRSLLKAYDDMSSSVREDIRKGFSEKHVDFIVEERRKYELVRRNCRDCRACGPCRRIFNAAWQRQMEVKRIHEYWKFIQIFSQEVCDSLAVARTTGNVSARTVLFRNFHRKRVANSLQLGHLVDTPRRVKRRK